MKSQNRKLFHGAIVIISLVFLSSVANAFAQQAQSQEMTTTTTEQETTTLPPQELDSLVAPIALYPDPLLAQTLAASTYPLEVIQLQQWMNNNSNLKGKALADAVAKQNWDPSVQGLVEFPDVVQRMAGNIQWTTDLGNAFLAQQSDVMDAVQRMRAKAQGTGNLKTSAQSVVQTETVPSGKQVITIQQANPDVVYVPSYDPTVVYGPAPPAYPYYPYTYPGYVPGTALMWGAGIALGAAAWGTWGGHWGNCDWNGGNVKINNNYNFNKNNNFNRNVSRQGQGNWQHNPQHRGNAPYGDRGTANRFGNNPRQQPGGGNRPGGGGAANRPGGGGAANRPGGGGAANRPGGGGAANRPGGGGAANRPGGGGAANRPGGGGAANRPGGGGAANRPGGGGAGARPSTRPSGSTARNQVGNRTASSRPSASRGGGFSGGSGQHARASSSRGHQSMSRGGGGHRGGGGGHRGGGGRGGGGRRR
jgi:hypothetical protein